MDQPAPDPKREALTAAFANADAAMNTAMQQLMSMADVLVDYVRGIAPGPEATLSLLYAVWPHLDQGDRLRFLIENLTPTERRAIQTGLWPDELTEEGAEE
jgi:hypothetical protein